MFPLTPESIPFKHAPGWHDIRARVLRKPGAVLFDSALPGELGAFSYASFAPTMLLSCTGRSAIWQRGRNVARLEDDPLALFNRVERFQAQECPLQGEMPGLGFFGGWAGLLGYDLRVFIEDLLPPKPQGALFPDLHAGFYPWVIAHDHANDTTELRLLRGAPGGPSDIRVLAEQLEAMLAQPVPAPPASALERQAEVELSTPREEYLRQVQTIKGHIREGDIYQANLTREVVRRVDADPFALYESLRAHNAAPFAGFLDCGMGRYLLSSSPERFVSVHEGVAETRPIKGTRARGDTPEEDARLKSELEQSEKDRAELTMIVDLERNDLSRVCLPGTVKVPQLLQVHSYARVHHLEATVQGRLREDVTPADLIRATFPGGSISGAPKKRALEIIHELEPVRRGPYTGSLFRLGPDGSFDSNILIRTVLTEPGRVSYHVGGGIVTDSDPEAEWDETLAKAAALESALEGDPPTTCA
jgi:para-aminobenzoate synthetase component I